jgi:hypothetical protein
MRWWTTWVLSLAIASVLFSVSALAAVSQPSPDGTSLPQPVPTAETTVVVSRGFAPEAVTLAGLFAARGQAIDPVADALAMPGTFVPRCGGALVTAEFVLSGGSCTMDLAWYNAVEGSAPADLHVLVPATRPEMACGVSIDFCPQATPSTYVGQFTWTPYVYTADVCNDAAYTGGAIGFALIGSPGYCTATKYSQWSANVACSVCGAAIPWITALIYPTQSADSYFLAFEDLPMTPASWRESGTLGVSADGDFNDFVFQLGGVCHGSCSSDPGSGGAGGSPAGGSSAGGSTSGGTPNAGGAFSGGNSGSGQDTGGSGNPSGGSQSSGGASQSSGGGIAYAGAPPSGPCNPGASVPCLCPNGTQGAFLCPADGSMYSGCLCTAEKSGCGCSVPASRSEIAGWLAALAIAVASWRRLRRQAK